MIQPKTSTICALTMLSIAIIGGLWTASRTLATNEDIQLAMNAQSKQVQKVWLGLQLKIIDIELERKREQLKKVKKELKSTPTDTDLMEEKNDVRKDIDNLRQEKNKLEKLWAPEETP
ncbi:MAG TPA: hypothetical protein VMW95_00715 [Desulfobacterales bacterium]|nr:hypothetical protein [Desulfobacterales bacterium]